MIHTAKFFMKLEKEDIYRLVDRYGEKVTVIGDLIDRKYEWSATSIYYSRSEESYSMNSWVLNLVVDFVKMLGRSNITENDYKFVENEMNNYIYELFGNSNNELKMVRLDYRVDIKVPKEDRFILLKLYRKSYKKHGFKKLKNIKDFDTSIYFQSKSVSLLIYDKEKERIDNNKEIQEYEKDILRMEVALFNRHLNYKNNRCNVFKDLQVYFNKSFYEKYINDHLRKFINNGDHYKLYISEKIIYDSDLKERDKEFLRQFLIDVSRSNLTGILNLKDDSGKTIYSKYKRNKAINMLSKLNINPISIPKNWRCKNHIKNPLADFEIE